MPELTHLSYSSVNTYLTCGEHWRRKYLAGETTRSTPALLFGSAMHNTIEDYVTKRVEPALGQDSLATLWGLHWRNQIEENTDCDWGADTPAHHYEEGVRILKTPAVQDLADSLTPKNDDSGLWLERKLELRIPGIPIPIIGYLDIMTDDGIPGDFKTSGRRWTYTKAQEEMQPLFYLAALNQMGIHVPDLKFRHYVITKTKTPEVQVIEHTHTVQEMFWLFDVVSNVWRGIQEQQFSLNPNAWLCNAKYCAYWSTCRGGGG